MWRLNVVVSRRGCNRWCVDDRNVFLENARFGVVLVGSSGKALNVENFNVFGHVLGVQHPNKNSGEVVNNNKVVVSECLANNVDDSAVRLVVSERLSVFVDIDVCRSEKISVVEKIMNKSAQSRSVLFSFGNKHGLSLSEVSSDKDLRNSVTRFNEDIASVVALNSVV